MTKKEEKMFIKNGVLDEKAYNAYLEYIKDYAKQMSEYSKENKTQRFLPKSEKEIATMRGIIEDEY